MCLVPDVAVEDFPQRVEDANDGRHHAEEDDPSHRGDALQHRVHPHTRHLVHPTRPEQAGRRHGEVRLTCAQMDILDFFFFFLFGTEVNSNG